MVDVQIAIFKSQKLGISPFRSGVEIAALTAAQTGRRCAPSAPSERQSFSPRSVVGLLSERQEFEVDVLRWFITSSFRLLE
jgi:hypothetical protein